MPIPDVEPTAPAERPFPEKGLAIVVTLEGFQHLVERVEALEGLVPATVPDDVAGGDQPAAGDVVPRLNRHRDELEVIKETLNAVIRFMGVPVRPLAPAPTASESYQ